MKLKIGISPCPNDTFIFDAIANQLIDISPYEFEFIFEDVETLNQLATKGELDIIKLSYAHYFNVMDQYVMLQSGSALGFGVGPLLISKKPIDISNIEDYSIAIPGLHTTAYFLLKFALKNITNIAVYNFADIEQAVLNKEVDAGVIIHENRFTYEEKGLLKLIDLGEFWETKTKLPIALGGIAIKRSSAKEVQHQINELIQMSILHSKLNLPLISDFVKCHAQEMKEDVMRKHIDLYVNENTIQLNKNGIKAIEKMYSLSGIKSTYSLLLQ